MATSTELLERYKPRLVILPKDSGLHRPWNRWLERVNSERGDYRPCPAEFFLALVFQRDKPASWLRSILENPTSETPTGLADLKARTFASPDQTVKWEMDLVEIESQNGIQAWKAYDSILSTSPPFEATMYGRCVRGPEGIGLEYWFLYTFNDATNKHEGDWEMIAIELDTAEQPKQAGYASHVGGLRRPWEQVEKDDSHPLVYVARGTHASYFDHKPGGHRTHSAVVPRKGWPKPVESAIGAAITVLEDMIVFLRLHDKTPAHPDRAQDEPLNRGEIIAPELVVLPEPEDVDESSDCWWMKLRGPWGSCHTRIFGDTAPDPPWEQGLKWSDPIRWLRAQDADD
jgi:hypothetical protein